MDLLLALIAGLGAGLGLAAPLGAIGILLVREGLDRGFAAGSPAAAAVALVDTGYCILAVTAAAVVAPVIASWGSVPAIVGGLILVFLGIHGIVRAHASPGSASTSEEQIHASPRRFLIFVGLTAINPVTLLYFAAVTVAVGDTLETPAAAVAFIAGVGAASFAWQLGLVAAGSVLRSRITARAQRLLSTLGFSLVVALGASAIVVALFSPAGISGR